MFGIVWGFFVVYNELLEVYLGKFWKSGFYSFDEYLFIGLWFCLFFFYRS